MSGSLINGSFEQPALAGSHEFLPDASQKKPNSVPGWLTTATDHQIEIWKSGYGGVPADGGQQFAELNANQVSTLYQDVSTTPGMTLRWRLAHRGREGDDTMALKIGPPGALVEQRRMTDGNTAWGHYEGIYKVPEGQITTRFAFESISAAGGSKSIGNFLDSISFGIPKDNLKVCQVQVASIKPGDKGAIAITVENPDHNKIDLTTAESVFDAPSGFEWTGNLTYTYYGDDGKSIGSGDQTTLKPRLENNNQRLRLTGLQDLKPGYRIVYIPEIKAKPDAKLGRHTDGQAVVADSVPLRLTSTVTGDEWFMTEHLYQPSMLEAKPGSTSNAMNVTVLKQDQGLTGQGKDLAGLQQQFQAPTGFRWTGKVTYAFYDGQGHSKGSAQKITQTQVTNNGKILTFTGMPKADEGYFLTYTLLLDADKDATVGRHDDGKAKIGNASPLTLHATVVEKIEPSNCNRD
jgi:hypothetical protein